jgi:hypothetical protein
MHLLRADASEGCVLQLWSLRGEVETVRVVNGAIEVERRDGVLHRHSATDAGWMIERRAPAATVAQETSVAKTAASDGATHGPWSLVATLDRGEAPPRHQHDARTAAPHHHLIAPDTEFPPLGAAPVVFDLGEDDYRRSELDWRGAGSPTARVALELELGALRVDVSVQKADPLHVPATQGENPLDNEPADTNADGVQLYVALPDGRGGERMLAWLAVPTAPHPAARVTSLGDPAATVDVRWAPVAGGYVMRFVVALPATARTLALDVVINETSPTRERRRGQLVLSGGSGYVYLRGARQPRDQFLTFSLPHV